MLDSQKIRAYGYYLHLDWHSTINSMCNNLFRQAYNWTSEEFDIWIWLTKFIRAILQIIPVVLSAPAGYMNSILITYLDDWECEFVRLSLLLETYIGVVPFYVKEHHCVPQISEEEYQQTIMDQGFFSRYAAWVYDQNRTSLASFRNRRLDPWEWQDVIE